MALNKRTRIFFIVLFIFAVAAFGIYLLNIRDYLGGNKVDKLIAKTDKSEERAIDITDQAFEVMDIDIVDDPRTAKRSYLEAGDEVSEARKELQMGISYMQDVQALKVPVWQKNYAGLRIQSLSSRIEALDRLKKWLSKMELVADVLQRTMSAQQKFNLGLENINESINEANNGNFDKAKARASKGKQLLDEAQQLLQEANKMEKDVGLEPVRVIVAKAQDFASLTIQLAEAGAAGKISEYNDIADRCESSKADVLKDWEPEVIKEPAKWYSKKTAALEKEIDNYNLEAEDLKESATVLYRKNTK